jgi:glycine cleavage system aminomethyltransferase T
VVHGWPTRFLPATDGVRISAVEVVEQDGNTSRHSCDSVVLDLGRQPRNSLLRMCHGLPVRAVGSAAEEGDLPPPPCSAVGGTVCACAQVTVDDLDSVYERGFTELELVKRATLAGTGTCQGSCCVPHLRSYLQARGTRLQPPFTARPVARQLTLGEMAAGAWHPASARSPLHEEHLRQGALMERAGGWWRPWTYGDTAAEIDAVRSAVSLGDVSTLGKFLVDGPDALRLLELLYPIDVSALRNGRCRYTLLLDERGSVLDDGMICRESASRFYLTSTSGGAGFAELWMRDWIESAEFDVRLLDVTHGRGAINVTGPQAARLLARGGAEDLPPFAAFVDTRVCGVPCRILRLSFTGELSYELHHDVEYSVPLWRRLLELGADLGVQPHGLAALLALRLEKGHIVVGKDTDLDATPRRLRHDWAISPRNQSFVGRQALERTGRLPLDRVLVGLESDLPVPVEGSVVFAHSVSDPSAAAASADTPEHVGYVTSAAASHEGDHAVMLAWVACTEGAETPTHFAVNGRPAHRVELPFYDPQHRRARGAVDHAALLAEESRSAPQRLSASVMVSNRFHRITSLRIASTTTALDRLEAHPRKATVLRCAQDEALVIDARWPSDEIDLRRALPLEQLLAEDPYALVVEERGFAGHWLPAARARQALRHLCSWPIPQPHDRPVLAQGAVAELPVKLWIEAERILFLVPAPFAATLDERLAQIEEPTA